MHIADVVKKGNQRFVCLGRNLRGCSYNCKTVTLVTCGLEYAPTIWDHFLSVLKYIRDVSPDEKILV